MFTGDDRARPRLRASGIVSGSFPIPAAPSGRAHDEAMNATATAPPPPPLPPPGPAHRPCAGCGATVRTACSAASRPASGARSASTCARPRARSSPRSLWIGIPAYVVAWIAIPRATIPSPSTATGAAISGCSSRSRWSASARSSCPAICCTVCTAGASARRSCSSAAGVAILLLRRPAVDDRVRHPAPGARAAHSPARTASRHGLGRRRHGTRRRSDRPGGAVDGASRRPTSVWTQTALVADRARLPPALAHRARARVGRVRSSRRSTLSLLLIGAGVTTLLQASGAVDVNLSVVLASATCFVGAVLVLSTWIGRARGLILVGIVLARRDRGARPRSTCRCAAASATRRIRRPSSPTCRSRTSSRPAA